ncbi:hypothetical protein NDU88_011624 [Pleurodeles waltl]|uniref:Protein LEG1 homolog n=1 Tax=Pleurodeles waltl TaxID=8319 RepID=A0AAV7S2T8_PLEWA|nr:hypothetical protein NDU88_011624 [Pleurodeles waltl]
MALSGALKKLLVCVVIVTKAAETADPAVENGFPPLWGEISGDLNAFRQENNHPVIDPWKYHDRMGMHKILLRSTHKYFIDMGLTESDNMLWSLPMQLAWQFVTGRLADPSKTTNCGYESGDPYCVSPSSWWACMNYFLSVVPFLAAAESGIFKNWRDETQILPPEEFSSDFCYTYASCYSSFSLLMDKWKLYFKKLMSTTSVSDVPSAVDELLHYLWAAHGTSIDSALPRCNNRLLFLPEPEADFAEDFAAAVHFLGATHFGSDYENIKQFQANLPPRMLRDNEVCPLILDFTPKQNTVCAMLKMLRALNTSSGGSLLDLWKQAMCSPEGRQIRQATLESMFGGKIYTLPKLLGLLEPHAGIKEWITSL